MHKQMSLALTAIAFGIASIAISGAQAQSVTRSGDVTVVRGNDHPGDRRQSRSSRGEGGVMVVRGNRRVLRQAPQPQRADKMQMHAGGENIWFVDPVRNRVVGCDLQRDVYGKRYVDCASGGY